MGLFSPAVAANAVDEAMLVAAEEDSNELDLAADKAMVATTEVAEVMQVLVVAVASAGRIMTSQLVTAMPASTSKQTGSCWRKLTSTALLS